MKNAIAVMSFALIFIIVLILRHAGYVPYWAVNAVVFIAGIYIYIESFNKYRNVRMIRDTATSKIGSLPMGLIEVYGKAKRLPGLFDIYHYLSVRELNRQGNPNLLSYFGIFSKETFSAKPFFIEDETGIVFVDPIDAEIIVNSKKWKSGDYAYKEEEIKEGDYVYCIGTAQRKESVDIAEEINKAIKEAKKSEDSFARFDTNNDGKISQEEWKEARKIIEKEIIDKSLGRNKTNIVHINKGKENSVFIISNKKEHQLIKKYYLQSVVLLVTGIAVTVYSLVSTFRG